MIEKAVILSLSKEMTAFLIFLAFIAMPTASHLLAGELCRARFSVQGLANLSRRLAKSSHTAQAAFFR